MIDALLQRILDQVEREYQMGGLSDGLYGDYAAEVARRYAVAEYTRGWHEGRDGEPMRPEPGGRSLEEWRESTGATDATTRSRTSQRRMS